MHASSPVVVRRAVRRSLMAAGLAAMLLPAAFAEESRPADDSELDTVIVSGSRLMQSGFTTPTPVTVLGADAIEELGITNIGAGAQQLPAFRATTTPDHQRLGQLQRRCTDREPARPRCDAQPGARRWSALRAGHARRHCRPEPHPERPGRTTRRGDGRRIGCLRFRRHRRRGQRHPQQDPHRHQGAARLRRDGARATATTTTRRWRAVPTSPAVAATSCSAANTHKQDGIGDCFTRSYCKPGVVVNNSGAGRGGGIAEPLSRRTMRGGFIANPRGVIERTEQHHGLPRCAHPQPVRHRWRSPSTTPATPIRVHARRCPHRGSTAAAATPRRRSRPRSCSSRSSAMRPSAMPTSTSPTRCSGFVEGSYGHVDGSTLQSRYFGAPVPIYHGQPVRSGVDPRAVAAGLRHAERHAPDSCRLQPGGARPAPRRVELRRPTPGARPPVSTASSTTTGAATRYYQYAHTDRTQTGRTTTS